uniref:Uncharacterized protein n=1 Tax=Anopheles culicifacies TaxID=139723 RepID=A0A182MN45_9DIPT
MSSNKFHGQLLGAARVLLELLFIIFVYLCYIMLQILVDELADFFAGVLQRKVRRTMPSYHFKRNCIKLKKYRQKHTLLRPFGYEPLQARGNVNVPRGNRRTEYSSEIIRLGNALLFMTIVGIVSYWIFCKLNKA